MFVGDSTVAQRFVRPLESNTTTREAVAVEGVSCTYLTPHLVEQETAYAADHLRFSTVNPVGIKNVRRAGVDALNRILGHRYEWVEEGEVRVECDETIPYVRSAREGEVIDIWQMSTAERWVHCVLWCLRHAGPSDVVLIDEPESFLATPGHAALIDEIARITRAVGCQTVVATHSWAMISRIAPECLRLITRGASGGKITNVTSAERVLSALSLEPDHVRALIYVEDDMAARMLEAIIRRFIAHSANQFDGVSSGGSDEAARAFRVTRRSHRLSSVCVLDGDLRTNNEYEDCLFLPGGPPEEELVLALAEDPERAAELLETDPQTLLVAIDKSRFVVHQRVFDVIKTSLGCRDLGSVIDRCIDVWLENDRVAEEARVLASVLIARASTPSNK
ncbi:ATP-binding protein [Actinobacteria bacterium YIM 96077]|uniref:ATPase AAA-type core domain-containing protein n=1 Tax=Phytoactinopolyspora halophila TaxID=1981511 RepID=A0A329QT86_9ACTN|nr:ATP-binding protein [Actinobacteria bacterium YIM 96077]RAW15604.1 hypothetical protein DPM12_08100 [Phytoactinopolyspora halophila]